MFVMFMFSGITPNDGLAVMKGPCPTLVKALLKRKIEAKQEGIIRILSIIGIHPN